MSMFPTKFKVMYVGEEPTRVRVESNADKVEVFYGDVVEMDRRIAEDLLRYKRSGFVIEGALDPEVVEKNKEKFGREALKKNKEQPKKKKEKESKGKGKGKGKGSDTQEVK